MVDIIPTRDRIKQFVPLPNLSYLLCGSDIESIHHLLFDCPASIICWLNSPWNICIQSYNHLDATTWFSNLLNTTTSFQNALDDSDKLKCLHFAVIMFEQLWSIRNKVRMGGMIPYWKEASDRMNRTLFKYWSASLQRNPKCTKRICSRQWSPPLLGELKFNMDVAYSDLEATSGVILRNHDGKLLGA